MKYKIIKCKRFSTFLTRKDAEKQLKILKEYDSESDYKIEVDNEK